jgi:hypothetical protein
VLAVEVETPIGHERQRRCIGKDRGHHRLGLRPLHGDESAVISSVQARPLTRLFADELEIVLFSSAVDDDVEHALAAVPERPGHHQVVQHAAGFVQKHRVADLARLQRGDIARDERLYHRGDGAMIRLPIAALIGQRQETRAHVRDVEHPGMGSRPAVLCQDAVLELHGHLITCERGHASAGRHVRGIERRALEDLWGGDIHGRLQTTMRRRGSSPTLAPAVFKARPR